jgi:glycerophosphoryl diester phosphodiesterase
MKLFPRSRPGHPYLAGAPLLVAHRGGAGLAPENTIHAFRQAVERWEADILELDVHVTKDGEVVVLHDDTVDRTTDGEGPVALMTWREVRDLDAGYRFRDPGGDLSFRGRGVRIPRFEEVLEAFPGMRLNVEVKTARAARPLVELVRAHGAEARVLVAAGDERVRRDARGYPGPWGASARQLRIFWMLHDTPLGAFYTPRCDVLQVPPEWKGRVVVTPSFLREAHRRNLPVHVWTVDDPERMRDLLALGVDAIQSDRPDRLARVLTDDFGRPPPPGLATATPSAP